MTNELSPLTSGLRTGLGRDTSEGAVVPPIYLSSNYTFSGFANARTYDYTRAGNPTRDTLGEALTTLEGGSGTVVCATGMGAITVAVHTLLSPGQTLVMPHDCYGGSWRLFTTLAKKGHFHLVTVDFGDEKDVQAALQPNGDRAPTLVWLETPSNPLLRLTDIEAVTSMAHAAEAKVVADNTFLSPLWQQPLALGVDAVIHSTTKYINGHSDVVGGAVVAGNPELHAQFDFMANTMGITGSPFDSYMTLRGLRTLQARLLVHDENTRAIVAAIDGHRAIKALHWPGLPSHPGHDIAKRQQRTFGAMLSIDLVGGEQAARAFVDGLQCINLAESLGGVESLVAHPATMTHASMTAKARAAAGIGPGLLRLSIGIEASDDLIADLTAALDRAARAT